MRMTKELQGEYMRVNLKEVFPMFNDIEDLITSMSRRNKIRNKSKTITDEQLEKITSLLHRDYLELNSSITLYEKRWQVLLDFFCGNYSTNLRHINNAQGMQDGDYISIFTFNVGNGDARKLVIIYNLLHELRHVYQMKYMEEKYDNAVDNYIKTGDGYSSQWIERDANSFATRMMNRNMEEINKILNINVKWSCCYGSFKKIKTSAINYKKHRGDMR